MKGSCHAQPPEQTRTLRHRWRVERVSSREQEVVQNVLMSCMAKLQDALQDTLVAIGDVIRVRASEIRKIHGAREYSWDVEHAAVADLAQDLDHNIQLETEELQKLDEARERAWHDGSSCKSLETS